MNLIGGLVGGAAGSGDSLEEKRAAIQQKNKPQLDLASLVGSSMASGGSHERPDMTGGYSSGERQKGGVDLNELLAFFR